MKFAFVVSVIVPAGAAAVRYHDLMPMVPTDPSRVKFSRQPYHLFESRNQGYPDERRRKLMFVELDGNSGDADAHADVSENDMDNASSEGEHTLASVDGKHQESLDDVDDGFNEDRDHDSDEYRPSPSDSEVQAVGGTKSTVTSSKFPTDDSHFTSHEGIHSDVESVQKPPEVSEKEETVPAAASKWTREFLKEGRATINSVMHSNVAKASEQRAPARKSARSVLYGLRNAFRALQEHALHEQEAGDGTPVTHLSTESESKDIK